MKRITICALATFLASVAACYRATVITGAPATQTTIDIPWQKSWISGLVPADTIHAKTRCPNGVARVMVEHSFWNGLVEAVTLGIYAPFHPVVTCASSPRPVF